MVNKIWKDRYRGKQDLIFTVVNKKKTWKDRYRGKQVYRGKQEKDLERSLRGNKRSDHGNDSRSFSCLQR